MSSRSTFSRLKELLAPLAERPWTTICMVLLLLFYEAIWLAVTEILRQIISLVEQGQSLDLVYERAWWAVACLGIFLFLSFATYKIFWYRFIISIERFLAKKYITKYIFMYSEEVVKYGVGKMIPLITSGFHDWSEFMYKLVLDMTRTLFAFFIFMLYIAWINPDLLWIAGCYTLFSVCWIWIVNKRAVFFRKRRHETHDEATSYIVKMLMEKFTILKNNKVEQEQMRLRKLYDVSELW